MEADAEMVYKANSAKEEAMYKTERTRQRRQLRRQRQTRR